MYTGSLIKNSIFNTLYQSLNVFFPLFSAAYVARILTPNGLGMVATAQNYVQYFVIFASLGIPNYGIREISRRKKKKEELNEIFSELFILNAISTSISIVIFLLCLNSFFSGNVKLYLVVGITILINFFNIDWFYQGIEEYGYIAIRSFIVKCLSFICLTIFVRNQFDYIHYAAINVLALSSNYIWNIIHLKKYKIKLDLKEIHLRKHVKAICIIFSSVIFVKLYTLFDVTLLSIFSNDNAVAYYTNCDKIVRIIITLITAVAGTLLPRLSQYMEEGKIEVCQSIVNRVFEILLFLFLPIGIALFILADNIIILLYGEQYVPAITTLRILSFLIYALGFSNLFGTQILLTFNKEKYLMICTLVTSVLSIMLNLVLIPLLNQNGAAITSVIVEALMTILTFFLANKIIHLCINSSFIIKSLVSTILTALTICLVKSFFTSSIACVSVAFILGSLVYCISSIFLKNSMLFFIFSKIKMVFRR